MFRGWPEIPSVGAVNRPGASDTGLLVNDDASAGGSEGRLIEVECSVELCLGGEAWINAGLAKEIERQGALGNEAAPQVHGKLFIRAAEAGDEVVFPAADGSFGGVASMDVRRH